MQQVPLSEVEKDEWFCSAAFQASLMHQQHCFRGQRPMRFVQFTLISFFRACRVLEFSPGLDFKIYF